MSCEEEAEYTASYYRCLDPIENLKIRVVLKPAKTVHIPLPQSNLETSSEITSTSFESQLDIEEYTFKWQEKILSISEFKKYSSETDWKKNLNEKYHNNFAESLIDLKNYPRKLFSYVEVDNYSNIEKNIFENKKNISHISNKYNINNLPNQNVKNFKNIPKRKVINYFPTEELKKKNHNVNKNVQRMFIMIHFESREKEIDKNQIEENCEIVLCSLSYNSLNNVLEVTPSFSREKSTPYVIGIDPQDVRNSFHYWLYHVSDNISLENLTKEIKLMSKVFDHQEELKKLQIDSDFLLCKPNQLHISVLGEISSAYDFEYDHLYVRFYVNLPSDWSCNESESLSGTTQRCKMNSEGVFHFCHLFEINFTVEVKSIEEALSSSPEIFFEILSLDNHNTYRNEGYACTMIPKKPGKYRFSLKCWRIKDNTLKSELKRFFIGGGPELEEISSIGLSEDENTYVISQFGFQTVPSGQLKVKVNVLHQYDTSRIKKSFQTEVERNIVSREDAGFLLGSINSVLEAFRRAKERMLEAKKQLVTESRDIFLKSNEC